MCLWLWKECSCRNGNSGTFPLIHENCHSVTFIRIIYKYLRTIHRLYDYTDNNCSFVCLVRIYICHAALVIWRDEMLFLLIRGTSFICAYCSTFEVCFESSPKRICCACSLRNFQQNAGLHVYPSELYIAKLRIFHALKI